MRILNKNPVLWLLPLIFLVTSCGGKTPGSTPATEPSSEAPPTVAQKIPLIGVFVDIASTATNKDGKSWRQPLVI